MSETFKQKVFNDHVTGASGLADYFREHSLVTPYEPEKDLPMIAEFLATQVAVNGEMVIAGAVVILSHSIADDVFTAACEMAVELDPDKWISELNMDRMIKLRDLKEQGPARIFERELVAFKRQLPDKSLPNRAKLFFRHVPIVQNDMFASTDPQYYSDRALGEADSLRIDIVHKNGLPRTTLKQSTDVKLFLHEAAVTALRSLGFAYNIPLDPAILLPGFVKTAQSSINPKDFYGE